MLIAVGLVLVVLLTLATGYFVAQEFAYVSVDRNRLRQLADEGDAAAARALDITGRLSFTLSGAQFGITVTALLVGYAGEPLIGVALADLLGFTDLPYAARLTIAVALVLVFSTVASDGRGGAGAEEPRHRPTDPAGPLAEPLDADLPRGRRTADPPLRRGFQPAAAGCRHRTGRGALARCHHRRPGARHRRVPQGRRARRGPLPPARARAGVPGAQRGTGDDPSCRRRHRAGHLAAGGRRRPPAHQPALAVPRRGPGRRRRRGHRRPGRAARGPAPALGERHRAGRVLRGGGRARVAAAARRPGAAAGQPPPAGGRRRRVRRVRRRADPGGHRGGGGGRHLRRGRRAGTRAARGTGGHAYPLGPAPPRRGRVVDRHPAAARSGLRHRQRPRAGPARAGGQARRHRHGRRGRRTR